MRYILLLPVIAVLGCAPATELDAASVAKKTTGCAELAALYKEAKNKKAEIETSAAEKHSGDIEEAVFAWPSLLVKRMDAFSDATAASKKMKELKQEMAKQNCAGAGEIRRP